MRLGLSLATVTLLVAASGAAGAAPGPTEIPPVPPSVNAALTEAAAAAPAANAPGTASGAAPVYDIAVLRGLNKVTARVSQFAAPVGQAVNFGSLVITVRACDKRPPEDPPQTAAFLEIDKVQHGDNNQVFSTQVFSGWMFAASPAISSLEDPVYDVTLLDCKMSTTAAPSSASPAK